MPPMENSCHVFLQKHSVPKDLGNNYAVKKEKLKQRLDTAYSLMSCSLKHLEYHCFQQSSLIFISFAFFVY